MSAAAVRVAVRGTAQTTGAAPVVRAFEGDGVSIGVPRPAGGVTGDALS